MNTQDPVIPWSKEELTRVSGPRVYRDRELDQIAFPLGGIGTGSISLGGWGQLRDFEIFNRPAKGLSFSDTFLTLHAQKAGDAPVTKVLQGPVGGADFTAQGSGVPRMDGAGLARFQSVAFEGAFPFARLRLEDERMPLNVSLEAFNPFIPLNADDSGLPTAMFNVTLHNPHSEAVKVALFANLENKIGHPKEGGSRIEHLEGKEVQGLSMSTTLHNAESPQFGTLALVTPHKDTTVQTHWIRAGWFDRLHRFWDAASEGRLEENREIAEREKGTDVGSIALHATLQPGETQTLPIWIVWHNPNFEKYWEKKPASKDQHPDETEFEKPCWKNYYATQFEDARAVAEYLGVNHERLTRQTRAFSEALNTSTLPEVVLDAVSSQMSILKSTTCIRIDDGTFWAWEGCHPKSGCCEGTCTHVWNYAQALPFLFPDLERSIRESDYRINLRDDGGMYFRMPLPIGLAPGTRFHSAADGQMGGIMKVYREWQTCGDDKWLQGIWPSVKKSLGYAWKWWDRDRDGVMEGVQHNTYDIDFHGPNTMMGSFYLGALRAAEEMALHLDDKETASTCRTLFASGREKMDAELFNSEYYVQQVRLGSKKEIEETSLNAEESKSLDPDNPAFPKYQYGEGCLSDQLIGQWMARIVKLGDLFDPEHVRETLRSIFRYNWKTSFLDHANPQRIYALNDEAGLLLCSWPKGGRPGLPFVYSDEVWCGIEYQVASHMIFEGLLEEGLAIVKGVRERHTGVRRNPWNEFECGNHYARSMASFALLPAISDFFYSAPTQSIQFAPKVHENDFACFFSVGSGWGQVTQKLGNDKKEAGIEVHYGSLHVMEIKLGFEISKAKLSLDGAMITASTILTESGTTVRLPKAIQINEGQQLLIRS